MDFWDKLFKIGVAETDPTFSINAFSGVLKLYAQGVVTVPQILSTFVDSHGNTLTPAEQVDAGIVIAAIDSQVHPAIQTLLRIARAERIIGAAHLAETGMVNKATAKTLAGV